MGAGAGGGGRNTKKKTRKGRRREETHKKPRKGAEPGLSISPEEHRRYVQATLT